MPKRRAIYTITLALAFLINTLALPVSAQFGIGLGSWGGNIGTWIEFWPWHHRHSDYKPPPPQPVPLAPLVQNNGYLSGKVTVQQVCSLREVHVACPLQPGVLSDVTVSAVPTGSNQWLSSRPDTQGHYRLVLPPGTYNLTVQHPDLPETSKHFRQIVIQPGQTHWEDFQITLQLSEPPDAE